MKRILFIAALALLASPPALWAFYKPVRVLAPEWVPPISCPTASICIEDESRFAEASQLYENGIAFVDSRVGDFEQPPRVIFCSTENCFHAFGLDRQAAVAVGVSGIVVSPRGWKPYYLQHEMIHHLQSERLGVIGQLRAPAWFTEGMAYALSGDPRETLTEPWQGYRERFESWMADMDPDRMWQAAREL